MATHANIRQFFAAGDLRRRTGCLDIGDRIFVMLAQLGVANQRQPVGGERLSKAFTSSGQALPMPDKSDDNSGNEQDGDGAAQNT